MTSVRIIFRKFFHSSNFIQYIYIYIFLLFSTNCNNKNFSSSREEFLQQTIVKFLHKATPIRYAF